MNLLPSPPPRTLLDHRFRVRMGTVADVAACYRIATRQPKGTLPKLFRVHFEDSARKRELHVAEVYGQVVGFARFHTRRDGWTTLYDLAIDPAYQGCGMGRNLLYSVPQPTRLKCPVCVNGKPNPANAFYANAGFRLTETDGKLNTYEMRVLTIFCAGGNADYPNLARQSRMAYGVRSDYEAFDYPFMVDASFKEFNKTRWYKRKRGLPRKRKPSHFKAIWQHRPVMALACDYEFPRQRENVLDQLRTIEQAGVLRPAVCVKFNGGVKDIPCGVVIAVSVPSRYSGFLPEDLGEYRGRRLHLLGGSPLRWMELIPKLHGAGAIVQSIDGSSHEIGAQTGWHFDLETAGWQNRGKRAEYAHTIVYSGQAIQRLVNNYANGVQQLSLFAGADALAFVAGEAEIAA